MDQRPKTHTSQEFQNFHPLGRSGCFNATFIPLSLLRQFRCNKPLKPPSNCQSDRWKSRAFPDIQKLRGLSTLKSFFQSTIQHKSGKFHICIHVHQNLVSRSSRLESHVSFKQLYGHFPLPFFQTSLQSCIEKLRQALFIRLLLNDDAFMVQ